MKIYIIVSDHREWSIETVIGVTTDINKAYRIACNFIKKHNSGEDQYWTSKYYCEKEIQVKGVKRFFELYNSMWLTYAGIITKELQ